MKMIGHNYPLVEANPGKVFRNLLPALCNNLADLRKLWLVVNYVC